MNIFIIGLPGVGKTTIGQQLATQLHFSFIDLDQYVEDHTGKTVKELFEQGEEHFRTLEREALQEMFSKENAVIAVGGGTPCFYDNMELMNQHGKTIYLHALPNEILSRFNEEEIAKRPLLKDGVGALVKLFKERKSFYEKAHIKASPFEKEFMKNLIDLFN